MFNCFLSPCLADFLWLALSNQWTGLGPDCWTGLLDWITGFNLVTSHDFHPIKFAEFDYLTINCTSSSHCMLVNVHECTLHKLHRRMCIMSSWCEFTAPSGCSKYVKKTPELLAKASLKNVLCHDNAGVKCHTSTDLSTKQFYLL